MTPQDAIRIDEVDRLKIQTLMMRQLQAAERKSENRGYE